MITRPLILRFPDDAGGGGAGAPAAVAAPAAPATVAPPKTPGPKPFTPSSPQPTPNFKPKPWRDSLNAHSDNPEKPVDPKPAEVTPPPTAKKDPERPAEAAPATEPPPPKEKVNNWKKLEQARDSEKRRADTAEARLREYEGQRVPDQERTALTTRMEQIQKRNDELENEIRFARYEVSKEFSEKFHQPYMDTLERAMRDLSRIPVTDATGATRAASEEDLFALMGLDPVKQLEAAESMFGEKLAGRAIGHAERVRESLEARNKALEEAKVNGKTREQDMKLRSEAQKKQFNEWIVKEANAVNEEWSKDPLAASIDLLKPREDGKEFTPEEIEHNAAVTRGIEMAKVLDGFHQKLAACKTVEERKALVKKATAFVKRGIHFGPLRKLYHKQGKELAEVKAKLAEYEKTSPTMNGGRRVTTAPSNQPFRVGIRASLQRHAGRR